MKQARVVVTYMVDDETTADDLESAYRELLTSPMAFGRYRCPPAKNVDIMVGFTTDADLEQIKRPMSEVLEERQYKGTRVADDPYLIGE